MWIRLSSHIWVANGLFLIGAECEPHKGKAILHNRGFQYHTERSDPNDAPIKDLLFKLKGILEKNHMTIMYPTAMMGPVGPSHSDILALYNHKIGGLLNYDSLAGDRGNLQKVIWFLVTSCALTLASEWKLRTIKKAFNKFGAHFILCARIPRAAWTFQITIRFCTITKWRVRWLLRIRLSRFLGLGNFTSLG